MKKKPYIKLMNPNYPIGHGTGMNAKEWEEFAKTYTTPVRKSKTTNAEEKS